MKWLHFDMIGIDQLFIRHQIRAFFTQRESSEGADLRWVGIVAQTVSLRFTQANSLCYIVVAFFYDINIQLFQKQRVAVAEPHLQFVGFVEVLVDRPRWRGPDIVLLVINSLAVDLGVATAANTEI